MPSGNSQNTTGQKSNDSQNIIDADKFMAITMDDISFKLSQLVYLFTKNQQILSSLLDHTIKNGELLKAIEDQSGKERRKYVIDDKIITSHH